MSMIIINGPTHTRIFGKCADKFPLPLSLYLAHSALKFFKIALKTLCKITSRHDKRTLKTRVASANSYHDCLLPEVKSDAILGTVAIG